MATAKKNKKVDWTGADVEEFRDFLKMNKHRFGTEILGSNGIQIYRWEGEKQKIGAAYNIILDLKAEEYGFTR